LEEDHYYPFGLTMVGLSDKTLKGIYVENKYRYNGKEIQNKEFSDGTGLEECEYGARMYDQQLGRFNVMDDFADKYFGLNPYQYGANDPIKNIDINGDSIWISINGQNYYFGNTKDGGWGFYGGNGEKYNGDDKFANAVSSALTGFANVNDPEVRDRFNTILGSKFKLVVEDGQTQTSDVIKKDGSRQRIDKDVDITNPNIIGAVIQWNPDVRNTLGVPGGADPDLDLAHELLGHGFQATVRNLRTVDQLDDHNPDDFVQSPDYPDGKKRGKLSIYENDAQAIRNRVAVATGRRNMVSAIYKSDATAKKYGDTEAVKQTRFIYIIDPNRLIQWNRNRKY